MNQHPHLFNIVVQEKVRITNHDLLYTQQILTSQPQTTTAVNIFEPRPQAELEPS